MRLAAIADMHGNGVAFEAVVADLKKQAPDAVICLGDVTMRGPQPRECVDLLRSLNPLAMVLGNQEYLLIHFPWDAYNPANPIHEMHRRAVEYDRARLSPQEQAWLGSLPQTRTLTLEGVQVELCHAAPHSIGQVIHPWAPPEELRTLVTDAQTRLVLYGHIHHAYARQAMGVQVVNPGSAGIPFDGDNRASYAVIDLEHGDLAVQLRRVPYDIEAAISIARERSMPYTGSFSHGVRHGVYPYENLLE